MPAEQHRIAVEQPRPARAVLTAAMSCSAVQESRRAGEAGDGRVARGMGFGERACLRTEAASWLVTTATANSTTTVTTSLGLSMRK